MFSYSTRRRDTNIAAEIQEDMPQEEQEVQEQQTDDAYAAIESSSSSHPAEPHSPPSDGTTGTTFDDRARLEARNRRPVASGSQEDL